MYLKYQLCALCFNYSESQATLKSHLEELKCHFTWGLQEKDADLEELKERLNKQLKYLNVDCKGRVYNLLAYVTHLKNDNTEAIVYLQKAEAILWDSKVLETDKKYLMTFSNYAWIYYYLNDSESSKLYIEKINTIYMQSKGLEGLVQSETYGEQGWALVNFCGQYYEKAKDCFEEALKANPDDPEWNTGLATVVYRLEEYRSKRRPYLKYVSFQLLERAVKLNPKDSVSKALFALKLQELKKQEEAMKYIKDALELTPDLPYVLRYVAKFYRRAGMFEEAIGVLKKAVSITPTSGFLHHQLGLCYRQMLIQRNRTGRGDKSGQDTQKIKDLMEKAIFHFEMVLEVKKSFLHAHFDLADMYVRSNQSKKAEETYKKATELTTTPEYEKQQAHLEYGTFLENCKKSEDEAVDQYKEGLRIQKNEYRQQCETSLRRIANQKLKRNPSDVSGLALLLFISKENQDYDPSNEE
ncbi:interferon-induced protein with tetratricopeptide repeats 5-like [Xenopus laevis]|uniref:Interferon-induced protein with tetratricopeptide repeats 5-like n=1 Tax=Xenopus laevis TaxID=8355 RepID=A0A8J1L6W1_XENLA|nr:interferon-induced protein with tetratricopeptide repeats 5-like [Xenopus laevis]